jgi:hypothetical protein
MEGSEEQTEHYPMSRVHCGAKTRIGGSCRQPAMPNGRCRLHGGKSLSGAAHGRYKHGFYTKEAKAMRRYCRQLLRDAKELFG